METAGFSQLLKTTESSYMAVVFGDLSKGHDHHFMARREPDRLCAV
jgi:hypothetical protein